MDASSPCFGISVICAFGEWLLYLDWRGWEAGEVHFLLAIKKSFQILLSSNLAYFEEQLKKWAQTKQNDDLEMISSLIGSVRVAHADQCLVVPGIVYTHSTR